MAEPADEPTQNPQPETAGSPTGNQEGQAEAAATEAITAEQDPAGSTPNQETAVASDSESSEFGSDKIEKLLDEATESLEQAAGDSVSTQAAEAFSLSDLTVDAESDGKQSIDLLGEVEMDLRIELGRTEMRLEEVLQLRNGSVVALDKLAGDPVDVFVNGRLIARGEVLVMNDNFCIRVTELVGA
ncbi:MAG: flagellar motor switch protein FliN [Rubripirellula sp.]|nr:flagellar motor switch protein FliN [Rubripirellula sp.]